LNGVPRQGNQYDADAQDELANQEYNEDIEQA